MLSSVSYIWGMTSQQETSILEMSRHSLQHHIINKSCDWPIWGHMTQSSVLIGWFPSSLRLCLTKPLRGVYHNNVRPHHSLDSLNFWNIPWVGVRWGMTEDPWCGREQWALRWTQVDPELLMNSVGIHKVFVVPSEDAVSARTCIVLDGRVHKRYVELVLDGPQQSLTDIQKLGWTRWSSV